jgi:hypothetical protein
MTSSLSRRREPSTALGAQHPPSGLAFQRVDVLGELGGDHDLVGVRGEGFADEFLVGVWTVDLGGVEECDAAVHGGPDQRDHFLPVRLVAVATGHRHTASPIAETSKPLLPKVRLFMFMLLSSWKGWASSRLPGKHDPV